MKFNNLGCFVLLELWYLNAFVFQVDGTNIQGFTNQQAVEVLRHTSQMVCLILMRREIKPEALMQSECKGEVKPDKNGDVITVDDKPPTGKLVVPVFTIYFICYCH